MNKIRIGNDILLKVSLLGTKKNAFGDIPVDAVRINSVKAYLINTTAEQQLLEQTKNKTKFISRFPIEPVVPIYTSTAYNINSSGYPSYHAFPQNYIAGSYAGFGPNPCWKDIYKTPEFNPIEYIAEVKHTKYRNVVQVLFPADAQLLTGIYKLVIVAKIYEPGYSSNNLRTVTMDYDKIFKLVDNSEEGVDSAVTLDVGIIKNVPENPEEDAFDTYVNAVTYDNETNKLVLGYNVGKEAIETEIPQGFEWEER